MKLKFYKILMTLVFAFLCASAIFAQNSAKTDAKSLADITGFRQKLSRAIEKRDRRLMEKLFAEDFTHTHAIGKVDGKAARIEAILTGDKTLESVQPDEIAVRFYGNQTAIATGQTTIDNMVYRWTIVYIKNGRNWQIAASQASRKV